MEMVYVKEANGEVWVDLGRHVGDRLIALEEAQKAIAREAIRERANRDRRSHREIDNHQL